ncbi:MAG TPA: hypothetical protein VFY15_01905, partial [Acidimicrobiia bacterium]|nr:hypothetical protein [Acidimicrobiia bacterium]
MTTAAPDAVRRRDYALTWVVGALLVLGVIVAAIGNEQRVQDWDPQYTKVVVDRTEAYGGTFYENGLFNKGPLELILHRTGSVLLGDDGHWIWIAFVSALLSIAIAFAASATARYTGAPPALGAVVGVFAFLHFTFADADYSGVVYPRNITVGLLSLVWLLLLSDRSWSTPRRRVITVASAAAILGLVVQSLLTGVFTAVVLLVAGYLLLRDRIPGWERLKLSGIAFVVGDVVFLSAVVWYAARGAFEEFWASWFQYARYVAEGTEASLGSQLGLGWDSFYAYHERLPLVAAMIALFHVTLVMGWKGWTRRRRILFVAVSAWWVTAWIEMILTQRYSSHYFSITAVPVTLMAALLVGMGYRLLTRAGAAPQGRPWWPVVATLVAIFMISPSSVGRAIYDTIHFQGTAYLDAIDDKFTTGNSRTARAVLDLYTDEGDPLLAWTNEPWPYLVLERVSATRFPW